MSEKSLKTNILTVISGLMSNEADLRRVSEDRRRALEFTAEYAIALIDIMMDFGEPVEERLMASLMLKQYIVSYWVSEKGVIGQPVLSEPIKEKIKKFLPAGIGDSNRQLRLSTAHIMAHIAALDYPDRWPNMMHLVQQMLQSVSKELVEGAVLFLKECIPYDIVRQLDPTLFNCLYEICSNHKYSTNIRATVISLITIFLLSDLDKNGDVAHERILNDAGKKFCELLAYHLSQPYCENSNFHFKSEIIGGAFIQFLYCEKVTRDTGEFILTTLPTIWEILSKCGTEYIQIIGNGKAIPRDMDEDENNPVYFMKLVNNIFALVQFISSQSEINKRLDSILSEIFYSIIIFMCITPRIQQEFIEDENSYCADEFNNMVNNTLRTDLKTLLALLSTQLNPEKVLISLSIAINKLLYRCGSDINPDDKLNWRVNESVMCTIGCVSEIFKSQKQHHESFNIYLYLRKATLIVSQCRNVILLARILLVVGRFSCCMSPEQVVEHLNAICIHLRSNQHILRNAAIRALNFHCQRISNLHGNCSQHISENMQKQHLQAFANVFNSLLDSLINVAELLNPMIFGTTIKNICEITNMNANLTATFSNRLIPFILNTINKNTQNALIINRCKELIVGLSKNGICGEFIQSSIMQPLLNGINYPSGTTSAERFDAQSVLLDVISVLMENAYSEGIKNQLYVHGFQLITTIILSTDDIMVSEMGTRCLCMYLVKCRTQITSDQQSALNNIMNVVYRFLDPTRDENVCKHIDKLIICALDTFAERFLDHNEKLIKCILSKVNFSHSLHVHESFNVIFLHYFYFYYDMTINVLSKIPAPTGDSALRHIIKLVVDFKYVRSIYGKYLHILVQCKIFENRLLSEDTRIGDVIIRGISRDGVLKDMSVVSVVFRSLVECLLSQIATKSVQDEGESEEYEDVEDSEVEEIQDNNQFVDLCTVLDDPISQKDVEQYLANYMRTFSQHESFKRFSETCLNDIQRQKLYSFVNDENLQYY